MKRPVFMICSKFKAFCFRNHKSKKDIKHIEENSKVLEKSQNEINHIKMWNWLANNYPKTKVDYFNEHNITIPPAFNCYACQESVIRAKERGEGVPYIQYCNYCPLCVNGDYTNQECLNGLFQEYLDAYGKDDEEAHREIALTIANLEWR